MQPSPAPIAQSLPDALSTALHSTPFQALTAAVALLSLVLATISFVRTQLRGPRIRFVPADSLGLVRAPLGGLSAIHLMGTLINSGGAAGALIRLEAQVRDGAANEHRFLWRLFYRYRDGGNEFDKVSDPQAIPVKAGDAVPVFFELSPADGRIRFNWPAGDTRVEVLGWVNAADRLEKPQVTKVFRVSVDGLAAVTLREGGAVNLVVRVPVVEWRHPEQVTQDPLEMDRAG